MSLQPPKPHLNASIQKDPPVFRPSFWPQNPEIRKTGAFCLKNVEKRPNEYTASIARFPGSVFRPLFPSNFGPKNRQFSPLNKRIKTHLFPRVFAPLFPLILATSRAPAPGPRVTFPTAFAVFLGPATVYKLFTIPLPEIYTHFTFSVFLRRETIFYRRGKKFAFPPLWV